MVVGSNAANFIAYIYHLIFGRILGPSLYGELAATISLIGTFSVVFTFLSLVIVKFVSSGTKKDVGALFGWLSRRAVVLGVGLLLLGSVLTPFLSDFLRVGDKIIILVGPALFLTLLSFVYKSFLQGLLRFWQLVIVSNLEFVGRLAIGLPLVFLGFSVFGAVLGILMATLLGVIVGKYFLRDIRSSASTYDFKKGRAMAKYTIPVFLATLATGSFYSSDIILVKHFFSSHEAGLYASLSTLGKIIFYGTAPIGSVMFPIISQRHAKRQNYKTILRLSFLLTLVVASFVSIFYWLFPQVAIGLLYGDKYLAASPYLFWFGLFMALFSLASLMVSYFLSIHKTKTVVLALIAALGQVLGIIFFHSSIFSVVLVSIVSVSFLLVSLLIYLEYETRWRRIEKS